MADVTKISERDIELASELKAVREQLKDAKAEARKVPLLRREMERQKAGLSRQRAKVQEYRDVAAESDRKLRSAKSRVVDVEQKDEEIKAMRAKIAELGQLRMEDGDLIDALRQNKDVDMGTIEEQAAEIQRLRKFEDKIEQLQVLGVIK